MLTTPTPERAIQLGSYRKAVFQQGYSEQVGSAYVGNGIGAAVLSEAPNEIMAPPHLPIVLILASSTRRRQHFDLLGRRTSAPFLADSLIVIPKGQPSWWASQAPMRNLHVHVEDHYLAALGIPIRDTGQPRFGVSDPQLARLGRLIEISLIQSDDDGLFLDHLLMAYVARALSARADAPPVSKGGLSSWALRRCVEHLESRLSETVTVAELAAVANLSPYHFARMFQQTTGHPPFRYQQRLRMEKAKSLLAETRLSVTSIAAAVGYETPGAFARVFRSSTGVTPRQWRGDCGRSG
ncbi:MAG: AraC family transcriptional regulator [Hyphomonadaceae bacterium]|nr:AraC family transcriptional regulator [Hyphomonadaceae bacterium]